MITRATGPGDRPRIDEQRWSGLTAVLDALEPVEDRAVTAVYFEGRTFRETATLLAVDEIVVSRAIAAAHRPVARHIMAGGAGGGPGPT